MVRDLNFPVEIIAGPIVRESDGLAMSSRNVYLNAEERKHALVLHHSLLCVKKFWEEGERDLSKLIAAGREEVVKEKSVRLEYFEIVDADSLDSVKNVADGALVAVAAMVGETRLIDNVVLVAADSER
jgi:pantoate--beta-alanine ligase